MLKLSKPVKFTQNEYEHISQVLEPLGSAGWDDQKKLTQQIKNHICRHTLRLQKCRCPYCEALLDNDCQLEHIVEKSKHGKYTFERYNIITACGRCNSTKIGKEFLVGGEQNKYTWNSFTISHPYLNDSDKDIAFIDDERTIIDYPHCTKKGLKTIEELELDSRPSRSRRAEIAHRRIPTGQELHDYIESIVLYNKYPTK